MNRQRIEDVGYTPTPLDAILCFNKCVKDLKFETVIKSWKPCLGGLPGRSGVVLVMDDEPRVSELDTPHDELHEPADYVFDENEDEPETDKILCNTCERVWWMATNVDKDLIRFCPFCGSDL